MNEFDLEDDINYLLENMTTPSGADEYVMYEFCWILIKLDLYRV